MTTIEGICNQALDLIGYPRHIGHIYEGTKAARAALDAWGQTRDTLLLAKREDGTKKVTTLTLMKSAPNIVNGTANYSTGTWDNSYPELPWLYEYQYPVDCIEPLQVKGPQWFLPIWRPRPQMFRLSFDATGNVRTILTNTPSAELIYIAKVIDPDDWQTDFIEMMVMALAKKFERLMPERPMPKQKEENASNASG